MTTSPHEGVPERIDPLREPRGVVSYHLAKYAFGRDFVRDATVVDVACGVGYGTAFLAPSTKVTVGVEVATEAIDIARERYRRGNCWFVQGNAEQLPFASSSVDTAVCFEGIEHFQDPAAHVAEVGRALRPHGVYLVSTPHPDAHTHGKDNPFHLHEFDLDSFGSLLTSCFNDVLMLGQRRRQTRAHATAQRADVLGLRRVNALRPLARLLSRSVLGTRATEEATIDDFVIGPFTDDATEYVAVCRSPRR